MSGKLELNQEYWDQRYQENNIPWDIGYASPAIVGYLKGMDLQRKRVLIPGAGNAYEAFWLAQNSDALITVVDLSPTVISALQIKLDAMNLNINLVVGDFFDHSGKYDVIIEQTFFCAVYPELRENYVQKMYSLMHKDSILFGLLFNIQFDKPGPPFGGFKDEYMQAFAKYFDDVRITHTEHSVPPRKGNEVFMEVKKPKNI